MGAPAPDLPEMSPEEVCGLVHELRTHQIELEMQNEELRRAQEELVESHNRYSDLYDFAPIGYLTTSDKGLILQANLTAAEMLGVERARLINRLLSTFIVDDDEDIYYLLRRQLLETRERQTCELRIRSKDGEPFWAKMESTLTQDSDVGGVRIRTVISDITERKRVEVNLRKTREELVRKTRLAAIGQVSASIAHDLRNPLGSLRNAAYYLKRHVPKDEPERVEFLEIIDKEVDAASRIISSLLALTRSSPVSRQTVDLRELVEDAFSRIADTDGVRCRVSTDPDPFQIQVSPNQFRQVFINLGLNSVQAMEGKGELVVEASRSASCDVIFVRDTGPGVRGDVREELFDPLVTTRVVGTGLGLTICRQIVEQHGGTIKLIDIERPGAAFEISLPREGQSDTSE